MSGTLPFRVRARVGARSEASPYLKSPGDSVIVERGRPRLLMLACPCGCGEEFPVNLDPRAGPAWRLYQDRSNRLSVFPSVWREGGCNSHYIIWRNKIYLFGIDDYGSFSEGLQADEIAALESAVRQRLSRNGLVSFADIADELNVIPWDVLTMCRKLVRDGFAREGIGRQRGQFGCL